MYSRERAVAVHPILIILPILICSFTNVAWGQRQFQLRQMRNEMSNKLETYSFGFSWDNKTAYDSLNATFEKYEHLLTNYFKWKNRPGNSVETDYLRLLSNYGISALDNQYDKDPLIKLLLEYDPYLIPDEADNSPDLGSQFKRFYPLPALKAGFKAGFNFNTIENSGLGYEVVQNSETSKSYSAELGWQIAFPVTFLLQRNHSISIEPGLSYSNIDITNEYLGSSKNFKYRIYYADLPVIYRLSILNPKLSGFKNINTYNQNILNRIDNEIMSIDNKIEGADEGKSARLQRRKENKRTKYDHISMNTPYHRVVPYLLFGIKPKFRISSFVNSNNANELTNWIQLDVFTGFGFEWYRTRNTYSLEFRYNYGLMDTNSSERYYLGGEVTGLLFSDFYVSDDFRLQIFEVSFIASYVFNSKAFRLK
jgi:hypothetical protein